MDSFSLWLSLIGATATVFLGIIGYLLSKWIASVDALKESVDALKQTVAVLENKNQNVLVNCNWKHEVIDRRLNDHSKRLDINEREIAVLIEKNKS